MKEVIEWLQEIAYLAKKHEWDECMTVKIQLSHVFAVLDFYELHKIEVEPLNVPDITPEWDKIDSCYSWVAIDESGDEHSYEHEPLHDHRNWRAGGQWTGTGRTFNMKGIDWEQTLSKRPAKQ